MTTLLRPGNQNIQPAFTALVTKGTEAHGHVTARVFAVANRNKNNVPLVALNILQVLTKKRLGRMRCKKLFDFGILTLHQFEFIANSLLLFDRKRGNT